MFVARVVVQTDVNGIEALVGQLAKEAVEVQERFSGCERFEVALDVADPHRVVIFEEWTDRRSADVYLTSDYFKAAGSVLTPLLVVPPDSVYYEATAVGP